MAEMPLIQEWQASDGYPIQVTVWQVSTTNAPKIQIKANVLILHGVQSHSGWYHNLGRSLASQGYKTHFTDRRGSGANRQDRGHTPSTTRLLADVTEYLTDLRAKFPNVPIALVGISWGGKLAVVTAGENPELVDAVALICPGLHPRVSVSLTERLAITLAYFVRPKKTFPIPLSDPSLFTSDPDAQTFIAHDPLGLRAATASLLASSAFLDRRVARVPAKVHRPALLMLADLDRIVDNDRTLEYWKQIATNQKSVIRYDNGHHTLEFDPDPNRYALDLAGWFDQVLDFRHRK